MRRSITDLVTQILRAPVPSVRRVNASVPAAVDQAIGRAIAKSAAERFETMQEFAAALPAGRRIDLPGGEQPHRASAGIRWALDDRRSDGETGSS